MTQKAYPDNNAVTYSYDNASRLTQVSDPTGTYQFVFDNMGRLQTTTTNYAFLTGRSFTTGYGYDAGSNRTGFTDPENGTTTYVYDNLNRLASLASPLGTFGFAYDALGRRTSLTRPNAVNTAYGYDPLSRLLSVVHQKAGLTLDGATYTVDAAGNRTSKGDLQAGVTSNYTYDAIYELTKTMQGASTTEMYSFDPVGNRTSSLGVSSYTTNIANELTATSNATYTYDSNGNTLTKTDGTGTTTYAWDFENRLTSVALPGSGGTVSFKYDPFGRRIYKNSTSGTSVFAYDGDNLVEETSATGGVVSRYTQGPNMDEPLAMTRSGATSYYHADGLGSITSLSDSTGASAATNTFDSFGNLTAFTGSVNNPFMYTARELDPETGLHYYRARYYDPAVGRFLGEDPIGFNGGTDFYSYVSNHSTDLVDPSGLLQVCCRAAHLAPVGWYAAISLAPPPCHCFLKLSDGGTLGGYHDWSGPGILGGLVLRPNDRTDHDKYAKEGQCTNVPGSSCENDARAKSAFGSAPKRLGGYGFGANDFGTSNDAAVRILKDAGFGYTLPACAWGKGTGKIPEGPKSGGGRLWFAR